MDKSRFSSARLLSAVRLARLFGKAGPNYRSVLEENQDDQDSQQDVACPTGPEQRHERHPASRVIALKCHLFALEAISAQFDMPLKFTTQENRSQSVTYASIL